MVEGDKRLSNQYAVILVNPAKHPNVKKKLGQAAGSLKNALTTVIASYSSSMAGVAGGPEGYCRL
jgi:ABC-type tungstate transport system permease subunit